MLEKVRKYVDKVLEWIVIVIMAVMVLNVTWQVVTRFVLKNPSSFTEELARYLLIWLGLFGASYGVGKKIHLAIDVFSSRFKGKSKCYLEIFLALCTFFFALFVMVIGGIYLVSLSFELKQISAALRIKMGYVYLAIPISGAMIMFYSLVFFVENFSELRLMGKNTAKGNHNGMD